LADKTIFKGGFNLAKKLIAVMLILGLMFSSTMVFAQGGGKERHPAIRAAIKALEKAKVDLEHAAHDFGGHRVEALKAVDNAINQLHQALEYDKK
jgi:hypothetical protein